MNVIFFRQFGSDFNPSLVKYLHDFCSVLEEHFTGNVKCKDEEDLGCGMKVRKEVIDAPWLALSIVTSY